MRTSGFTHFQGLKITFQAMSYEYCFAGEHGKEYCLNIADGGTNPNKVLACDSTKPEPEKKRNRA